MPWALCVVEIDVIGRAEGDDLLCSLGHGELRLLPDQYFRSLSSEVKDREVVGEHPLDAMCQPILRGDLLVLVVAM